MYDGPAVAVDADHWIVVVHQFRTFYIFQPQSGMCTLARATLAEKHIALTLVAHYSSMEQRRPLVGRT